MQILAKIKKRSSGTITFWYTGIEDYKAKKKHELKPPNLKLVYFIYLCITLFRISVYQLALTLIKTHCNNENTDKNQVHFLVAPLLTS